MPSPVLYRKWRPQTLTQVVGQEHVTRTLVNALATGRVSHAYLFSGPRGTGKTSTARILAKALNCINNGKGEPCCACPSCEAIAEGRALDLVEIDAASNRGIDDIRELRDRISYAPAEGRYKVYIIDEVHMLTDYAFNALLKTLEEPPGHAVFALATTEVHRVPVTILSRCQRFDFRRIPQQVLADHLEAICKAEKIEAEREALELIARQAGGSARDAVNLLEQVEVAYGGRVQLAEVQGLLGLTGDPRSLELVRALSARDVQRGMSLIQEVREAGISLPQFSREVASLLRTLLLLKAGVSEGIALPPEAISDLQTVAAGASLTELAASARIFSQIDFQREAASSLPLELAFLEAALSQPPAAQAQAGAPQPEARPYQAPARATGPERGAPPRAVPPPTPVRRAEPAEVRRPVAPGRTSEGGGDGSVVAEASPTAQATGNEAAGAETADELARVRQLIREARVPQMKFIESLFKNACSVERVEGRTVVLGFRHSSHKERVEKPENMRLAEQALKEVTGTDYRIRCIVVDAPQGAPGSGPTGHLVRAALEAGAQHVPRE